MRLVRTPETCGAISAPILVTEKSHPMTGWLNERSHGPCARDEHFSRDTCPGSGIPHPNEISTIACHAGALLPCRVLGDIPPSDESPRRFRVLSYLKRVRLE